MPGSGPLRLLLVEVNPADVRLTQVMLDEAGIPHELATASNGEEALSLLQEGAVQLDAILLDLHLPRMEAADVLDAIEERERLEAPPVVLLSGTPPTSEDLAQVGDRVAGALVKPLDVEELLELLGGSSPGPSA